MTGRPNIVIVEDEPAQLLVLKTILKGIGDIHDFADPIRARAFMKDHAVDVAIIDVHMPNYPIDGLAFVRSLRETDRELSVIIRTADTSTSLADEAIELRAFRRAIKGQTTMEELRDLTLAAIEETRLRRQVHIDAARTNVVKDQWVQTLGSVEEAFSVSDTYQALVQGMQNQLTALAGIAEVMDAAAQLHRPELLREHVAKNKVLVSRLLSELSAFLTGPFAQTTRLSAVASRTTANGILEIVQKHFLESEARRNVQRGVSFLGLEQDIYISAKPLRLLIALRHLIEFCLERSAANGVTYVSIHCIDRPITTIDSVRGAKIVLTERSLNGSGACIVFRARSPLGTTSLQEIHLAFRDYPENPHMGNLQMITLALRDELAAVTVHVEPSQTTVFQLYVAIAA